MRFSIRVGAFLSFIKVTVFVLVCHLSFLGSVHAQFRFSQEAYAHLDEKIRIGIEVEFSNLSLERAAEVANVALRGKLIFEEFDDLLYREDPFTKKVKPVLYRRLRAVIKDSLIGDVIIKPEDNDVILVVSEEDQKKRILELVTEPLFIQQAHHLQKALEHLKAAGAWGTDKGLPVSLQVSVELGQGQRKGIQAKTLIALMRLYSDPQTQKELAEKLEIPDFRKPYVQAYSEEVLKRVRDPYYSPSLRELYDDLMYRQMWELMGEEKAWTLPIRSIKKQVLHRVRSEIEKGHLSEGFFRVIKFTPVKVASALVFAFPRDPLSKLILATDWIHAIPAAEFRDRNNDFNLFEAIRMSVGFVNQARLQSGELCEAYLIH